MNTNKPLRLTINSQTFLEFKTFKSPLFSATWCPDCVMLDRYFEESINKFPEIKFIYINRDDFPEISEALDIFGIPSFVTYKDNKEVSRFVSRLAKTQEEVEQFLSKI